MSFGQHTVSLDRHSVNLDRHRAITNYYCMESVASPSGKVKVAALLVQFSAIFHLTAVKILDLHNLADQLHSLSLCSDRAYITGEKMVFRTLGFILSALGYVSSNVLTVDLGTLNTWMG